MYRLFKAASYAVINATSDVPPTHELSDYIIITMGFILTAIALPINLSAARTLASCTGQRRRPSRLGYINCHLIAVNLCAVMFSCLGKSIWHIFYSWHAGDTMCRVYKFLQTAFAYCTSNITVTIALDMLISFKYPFTRGRKRAKRMLMSSWCLAFIFGLPQLYYWGVVQPFPDFPHWEQCIFKPLEYPERSLYVPLLSSLHLCVLFWIPLFILIPVYGRIVSLVLIHNRARSEGTSIRLEVDAKRQEVLELERMEPIVGPKVSVVSAQSSRASNTRTYSCLKYAATIIGLYVISWLPYQIVSLWEIIDPDTHQKYNEYTEWLYFLYTGHNCLNPLIYPFHVQIRQARNGTRTAVSMLHQRSSPSGRTPRKQSSHSMFEMENRDAAKNLLSTPQKKYRQYRSTSETHSVILTPRPCELNLVTSET